MLNTIKKLFNKQELLKGNFGIEREGLRVDYEGKYQQTLIQRFLVIK